MSMFGKRLYLLADHNKLSTGGLEAGILAHLKRSDA